MTVSLLTIDPAAAGTDDVTAERRRLRIDVRGAVQGVGFRPFVHRLATGLGVAGWVVNDTAGVRIEVEGDAQCVQELAERLVVELPPLAAIHEIGTAWLPLEGATGFEIRHSAHGAPPTAMVLPDAATCDDCLHEVLDETDRRHGYAFTNCTNCGPRYSIVEALPYDRANTTMRGFTMCPQCRVEYTDPRDRRFHAQPNACPVCGPQLALLDAAGRPCDIPAADAIAGAGAAIRAGEIVAVKGIGGFLLMVDARNDEAVQRLRARKHRPVKPLAAMVSSLAAARELCVVSDLEAKLLRSPEAPIVLLERLPHADLSPSLAPGMRRLGAMLAYAPLHHLLLRAVGGPVVATSGNLSEEPICTDSAEAVERLRGIADFYLVHDRPIARHVDDSVAWVLRGRPQVLRRARGYAPYPLRLPVEVPPIVAVGAHQKGAVAVAVGRQAFVSQHIGDLESVESLAAFERVVADLTRLYEVRPIAIAHDLHPDYATTTWARERAPWHAARRIGVQHHHAHLASCLADNGVTGRALGIVWDGSGYGARPRKPTTRLAAAADEMGDGTVWGGECLAGDAAAVTRVAHLAPFRLLGGEAAVREPRRAALGLLRALLGEAAIERTDLDPVRSFTAAELRAAASMLRAGVRSPITTSAGRLFDGVAALLGLRSRVRFEGEAAMALEQLADPVERGAYPLPLTHVTAAGPALLDWHPLLEELLAELDRGVARAVIAARFHNALVDGIVAAARHAGESRVALTGGCFQNRLLVTRAADALEAAGFEVLVHRHVPPNDGGIALGQIAVAAARLHLPDQE